MTLQEQEKSISDFYGQMLCPNSDDLSLEEVNESMGECQAMLNYSIEMTNKEEIAFWRKMLQQAKVQKRRILDT